MIFAADKNFPKFVHNDTIIKTFPELPTQQFFLPNSYQPLKKIKKPFHESTLSHLQSQLSNTTLNKSLEKPVNSVSFSLNLRQLTQNESAISLQKQLKKNKNNKSPPKDKELSENFSERNHYFQKYMEYQREKHPEAEKNEMLFRFLPKKHKNKSYILEKKQASSIKINKTKAEISENKQEPPSIVSLKSRMSQKMSIVLPSINETHSYTRSKLPNSIKRLSNLMSFTDLTRIRIQIIPNFKELVPVLKKLERNLNEYFHMVGYNDRAAKILKNLLSKKINMKGLFFHEDNGKLIEPISLLHMEEQCIIRETVYENGKFVKKDRVDPLMIEELKALDLKIEEMKNEKYIEDLKTTKDSLLEGYSKLKEIENKMTFSEKMRRVHELEPINRLNFEVMPNICFMKEIEEFERQFGECDLIDKKNIMISKALEEVIGEIKRNAKKETDKKPVFKKKRRKE